MRRGNLLLYVYIYFPYSLAGLCYMTIIINLLENS